jgi:L-lactate dehydrogenase (cytochrome)
MLDRTSAGTEARSDAAVAFHGEKLRRRFPTIESLRRRAKRRVPRFAFDFVDGAANDEECARRNRLALSAVELLPRYCIDADNVAMDVELFDRRYSAPFGVAPMGSAGMMWPGAEIFLAREAQRRRVPYILATPANASIERIAEVAPDVFWFQLYRFPYDDHAITFDLLKRADAAGAHVLVPTIDSAGKSKRPRDMRNAVKVPFRVGPKTFFQIATSPAWAIALSKTGMLRTENIVPYTEGRATRDSTAQTMQMRARGSHTWDELARLRDRWKRAFVVKGVLHPKDAERLVSLGVDGLIVSNHGGRHFDGAPASVDMLPAIMDMAGKRATVMMDSGIRSGLDILRVLALGARAAFIGRPFLYGLGALGEAGARHVMDMFAEELRTEFQHVGIRSVAGASEIAVRHAGAWRTA